MPELTKSTFNAISCVLKERKNKVKVLKLWRTVYDEFAIGRLVVEGTQTWLYFDVADREKLRTICIANTGKDPLGPTIQGLRSEMTGHNEKWATESIQRHMVYCTSFKQAVYVSGGAFNLPAQAGLWLDYRNIDIARYERIIIVENLEAFIFWSEFNTPESIVGALVLYRGHDISAKAVQQFLTELSDTFHITVFSDPDPSGLKIILDTPYVSSALIPENVSRLKPQTNTERFAKQLAVNTAVKNKAQRFSAAFQIYVAVIVDSGIAISQEKLCHNKIPLKLIDV